MPMGMTYTLLAPRILLHPGKLAATECLHQLKSKTYSKTYFNKIGYVFIHQVMVVITRIIVAIPVGFSVNDCQFV